MKSVLFHVNFTIREYSMVSFWCFLPGASHVCNITGPVLLFAVFTMVSKSREIHNDVGCRVFFAYFAMFSGRHFDMLALVRSRVGV